MRLTVYDLKPSYRIRLKYQKSDFILLTNGRLANMETGECALQVTENMDIIDSVFDAQGKQLAIKIKDDLIKYDKTKHDDTIVDIKRRNSFMSIDELEFHLLSQKVNHPRLLFVDYAKEKNSAYKTKLGNVNTQVWIAEFNGIQKIGQGFVKVTVRIKKYLIYKKENLYLYRVDVFHGIF